MTKVDVAGNKKLSKSKEALIRAAEKLIAEKGLEGVSYREISKAAGQKNNSAVQYHFGDRENLIESILDYRMVPLNQTRCRMLEELEPQDISLRKLIKVMVMPYIWHLLEAPDDSYYISLFSQLYQRKGNAIVPNSPRSSALFLVTREIFRLLPDIPREIMTARLKLAGMQLIHTVADWDVQRRKNPEQWSADELMLQTNILIDYIVGGLVQKAEAPSTAEWRLTGELMSGSVSAPEHAQKARY